MGLLAALAASGASVAAAASHKAVSCPAAATSAPAVVAGAVQWEFSEIGPPAPAVATVSSSWTRGSGTWMGARAAGAICSSDSGPGAPGRDIVLHVAGAAKLSPQVTRLGLLGVAITLGVTVAASDDGACAAGTAGTVALFASYYGVRRDSISLHFAAACSDHDHTYTGAAVHVLIARAGHQVSSVSG